MRSWRWYVLIPVLLLLPGVAFASAFQICGIVCSTRPGPVGSLSPGQSVGPTTESYALGFVNGDDYLIGWTYSASYDGITTHLSIAPTATYTGVNPSLGDDLVTFRYFQDFFDDIRANWNGNYTENVPLSLSLNAGAGSTVSGELFYGGQTVGLIGPYGPGNYSGQKTTNLSGLTDPTLAGIFEFKFDFHAGTPTNAMAGAVTPAEVPEPAQTLPVGIAFLGAAYRLATRRRWNRAR